MFPNVRLMIVAISASLLAIICAMSLFMGMFAALGVAHEPFSSLAVAKPPLQIAFADEISTPVADGKPAPFGVRFRLNAPQVPSGPVIVTVPAALDRASPPDAPPAAEPVTNPAANSQSSSQPDAEASASVAALAQDDATPPPRDAPAAEPVQAVDQGANQSGNQGGNQGAMQTDDKAAEVKPDGIAGDDTSAAATPPSAPSAPAPPLPAPPGARHHIAPQIRIASREPDNPASVTTSPAPTLARKVLKRRRFVAHLRQSHHFRRPRVHQLAASRAQPAGFVQPNAFTQPGVTNYTTGASMQPNGFMQPGFGFTPAAIKPRATRWRHAAEAPSGTNQ
jgi:hypothetical protein